MRSLIAAAACIVVLGVVNYSIAARERLLAHGKTVYLELAPVDPRSLMQGDYMALRFKIADDVRAALERAKSAGEDRLPAHDGRIVATVDASSVAAFQRIDDGAAPALNEIVLKYRVRNGEIKFATNAYFFEEGTAPRYERARYGEFRVAEDGDLLLTGMRLEGFAPAR